MTLKQERFCQEYVKSGNATQAYKTAYGVENEDTAKASAYRLLQNENVKNCIEKLNNDLQSVSIADLNKCLQKITKLMESNDENIQLKATDLRLKTLGAYLEKREINGNMDITVNIE